MLTVLFFQHVGPGDLGLGGGAFTPGPSYWAAAVDSNMMHPCVLFYALSSAQPGRQHSSFFFPTSCEPVYGERETWGPCC